MDIYCFVVMYFVFHLLAGEEDSIIEDNLKIECYNQIIDDGLKILCTASKVTNKTKCYIQLSVDGYKYQPSQNETVTTTINTCDSSLMCVSKVGGEMITTGTIIKVAVHLDDSEGIVDFQTGISKTFLFDIEMKTKKKDLGGSMENFVWFAFSVGFFMENFLLALITSVWYIRRIFTRRMKNDQQRRTYDQLDLRRDDNQDTQLDSHYETFHADKEKDTENQASIYEEPVVV